MKLFESKSKIMLICFTNTRDTFSLIMFRKEGLQRFGKKFYSGKETNGASFPVKDRKGTEPTFWEFITALLRVTVTSTKYLYTP
jgi:hypothetical protein